MAAMEPRVDALALASELDDDAPRGRFGSALIDPDGRVVESDGVWDRSIGIPVGARLHDAVLAADVPVLEDGLRQRGERLVAVVRCGSQNGALVSLLLLEGVHRDGVWYTIGMRSYQPRDAGDGECAADPITGLPDRAGFSRSLEDALRRSAHGDSGALLLLDLDGFKSVNDAYGHAVGDRLLAAIGRTLRTVLRDGDHASRLGGDEFAVVLHRATQLDARAAAERMLDAVARAQPEDLGIPVSAQASAGLAMLRPGEALDPDAALERADLALYEAKADARARLVEFPAGDPEASARMRARLTWGQRLHRALEADRLEVHAQTIVDLRTGEPAGCELVLHLSDGDEPLPAERFLHHALRAGLAERLDQWLLARALEAATQYRMGLRGASIEIVVSGSVLADRSLAARLQNQLGAAGSDPERLVLAVRDGGALEDRALAIDTARALRRLGVGLALDGFGTSRGALDLLRDLPFSQLAIARPFTAAATANALDDAAVRYAVELGERFGIDVVGGGLESPQDVERARELGVRFGRGGVFGGPVPLVDAIARAQPAPPAV